MSKDTIKTLRLIYSLTQNKKDFFVWLFVRLISALFPIATVYLYSRVVRALEMHSSLEILFGMVLAVLVSRFLDNFTRLLSTKKLDYIIACIQLNIQDILVSSINTQDKKTRHKAVQAIRNFSDASATTLMIFKQPGIDSVVSFLAIPIILLFIDFRVFILQLSYMIVYYYTDIYTTEKYAKLKNKHNSRVESYYAKLQTAKDFKYEQTLIAKTFKKVCNWGVIEWNLLQNTALVFYILILIYLVYCVSTGQKTISDLVLIIGYIDGTQVFLNNISSIKDSMADTKVALHRLLDNKKTLAVDYNDLTT